jgi:hypothetical protein
MMVVPGRVLVMCHMTKDPMTEDLVSIALAGHDFRLVVIATPYEVEDVLCFY